ncbi:MAG: zinc ribbon domain-containing protein [Oscillospiraceae bacterium]|nr:zinc ribbon domain-containing protein [Oscillospiraceae bacterium]
MKKVIAILLCSILLAGIAGIAMAESRFCPFCGQEYPVEQGYAFCPNCGKALPQKVSKSTENEQNKNSNAVTVGDVVSFGRYEQDNDQTNGAEGIEWIVLDVQGEKALLLSKYGLNCKTYYKTQTPVTWETSDLRTWLNGEFFDSAFNKEEQGRILTSNVTADKNPEYNTDPGNDTKDDVFLLSAVEVNRYLTEETAKCTATAYALAAGASSGKNGNSWWFLRTPGSEQKMVMIVKTDGTMNTGGGVPDGKGAYGVNRPALWIDLSNWETYEQPSAGENSTENAQTEPMPEKESVPAFNAKDTEDSPYVIGSTENTFAGLHQRMCVNLDLKANPIPKPDEDMGAIGSETLHAKVLKDDSETYEYIGYCRGWDGKDRYICWSWTGIHEDGSTIAMLVFYTPEGKYLGNIQRDLSAGTSTSSSRCPYYVPGEPINKK